MASTSHFMFNPDDPNTVTELEKYEEFRFTSPDKQKVIAYIIWLYDQSSDLKKLFPDDLYRRKREAALRAGFLITNGRFDDWVEDFMVGQDDKVNEAALMYVRMSGLPDASSYMAFNEILQKQILAALKETDEGKLKVIQANIKSARDEISDLEAKIWGGKEVENVRAALYRLAENQRLNLRPEHIAQQIADGSLTITDPYAKRRGRKRVS